MIEQYTDSTASVVNSEIGVSGLYKYVNIRNSTVGNGSTVGDYTVIERSCIADNVAVNRRNHINDSVIGSFSYTGIDTLIRFADIGKFCSIAPKVDIGGVDHDYRRITTMPENRFRQLTGSMYNVEPPTNRCSIGNDVWIATGAVILGKCSIGDGAVIGAGTIVTKDVPPYSIVAGNPGRVIKYRFSEDIIEMFLKIRWWDWSIELLKENSSLLMSEPTAEILEKMLEK